MDLGQTPLPFCLPLDRFITGGQKISVAQIVVIVIRREAYGWSLAVALAMRHVGFLGIDERAMRQIASERGSEAHKFFGEPAIDISRTPLALFIELPNEQIIANTIRMQKRHPKETTKKPVEKSGRSRTRATLPTQTSSVAFIFDLRSTNPRGPLCFDSFL